MAESHYSFKFAEKSADICLMFPDSQIASEFKCDEMKIRYLITGDLALHFFKLLQDSVRSSHEYVLLFDASLNHKTQTKQLDFHVR